MKIDQSESNEEQDGEHSPAEELNETLAEDSGSTDESLFVVEEKQPVNRSTLVMFGILVIGAAGLYFMYRQSGPKSAAAATVETVAAKKTISTFLSGGDASFKSMEQRLKYTEKIVQQFLKYPSTTQVPLTDLLTNPFRQRVQQSKKTTDSNNEALSEAAEKKKREEERLAIKKNAEGLQLQSIMSSETRKICMINNTLYREGQSVGDFVIEKISPSTVVVKNGPYRFELRMQR